jgi:hypothetical protein
VVSQHAEKDVRAHAIRFPMVDGAHVQIHRLQTAEGALHLARREGVDVFDTDTDFNPFHTLAAGRLRRPWRG